MSSGPTNRILFVDDDTLVLRSVQRGLRKRASDWDLVFAENAAEAMQCLATTPIDILVTDLAMPTTNGIELLHQVRNQYPSTVRIMMSGTSDAAVMMKAIPVAHQFLSKPSSIQSLIAVIQSAASMRNLLNNEAIATIVGSTTSLPALPSVYKDLCAALELPTTRIEDIVSIVERDPAVLARLLQVVNSAFFGAPAPLHSSTDAVRYIGATKLKNIILSTEIFGAFDTAKLPKSFSLSELQAHAFKTSKIACRIATDRDRAMSAGLLHDIGQLILADRIPEQWGECYAEALQTGRSLDEVEREHLGTTHAEVGAYLLGIWGLPQELVEAVAGHHHAIEASLVGESLASALRLASALANDSSEEPLDIRIQAAINGDSA